MQFCPSFRKITRLRCLHWKPKGSPSTWGAPVEGGYRDWLAFGVLQQWLFAAFVKTPASAQF